MSALGQQPGIRFLGQFAGIAFIPGEAERETIQPFIKRTDGVLVIQVVHGGMINKLPGLFPKFFPLILRQHRGRNFLMMFFGVH